MLAYILKKADLSELDDILERLKDAGTEVIINEVREWIAKQEREDD